MLFVIEGAEEFRRSRLNDDSADDLPIANVGIDVIDDQTLQVRLRAPTPYFLELAAFVTLAPVFPPLVRQYESEAGRVAASHMWLRPGTIVCNGPFVLKSWEFKRGLRLVRNEQYWDRAAIQLRDIEAFTTSDRNTALIAYETGKVDYVRSLPLSALQAWSRIPDVERRHDLHIGDRFCTYFYRLNCRRPPFDRAEFRIALALAIDRDAICNAVLGLGERPAITYVPPLAVPLMPRKAVGGRTVYYAPPDGLAAGRSYVERCALAREYLARSGFLGSAGERAIEIGFPSDPEHQRIGEAVQQMWERELGIRVELRETEAKVLSQRIRELDYDVVRSDWFGDYLDPSTFLSMFTTGSGQNRTGWSNARYDELIAAAEAEADNERRFALFQEAERILVEEEMPIIPIFYRRGAYLLNDRFESPPENLMGRMMLARLRRR
jgi:oligopeptide transport system substrate-binding protein